MRKLIKAILSKEDKQAVKDHVNSLKDIAKSDASPQEKAKAGIEDLTPADRQQIDKYQEEIRKALKNTNNRELQPEQLEADLKRISTTKGRYAELQRLKPAQWTVIRLSNF